MAHVLYIDINPALTQTRKLFLEQAGHNVITASNASEVTVACADHRIEVAILSHVLSPKIKKNIAFLIRSTSDCTKILELTHPHQGKSLEEVDDWGRHSD